MNDQEALDLFGYLLIKNVRNQTISEWNKILKGQMQSIATEQVKEILSICNTQQIETLNQLIPQIVDTTIHHLLFTLEQKKVVNISIEDTNNDVTHDIKEISDGLSGELYGQRGWIARFSTDH